MADEDHLAVLKRGVAAWNEWRRVDECDIPTGPKPDLSGANLANAKLNGINFSFANLRNSNLNDASLVNAKLTEATVAEASLCRANLAGASMRRVDFERASLVGIDMSFAFLSRATLSFANLDTANLLATNFERAQLYGASLRHATLRGGAFTDAGLSKVNFAESDLREAHLEWSELSEANFSGADLRLAGLTGASLAGADFENAFLGETVLADLDFTKVLNIDKCLHNGPSVIDHRTLLKSRRLPLKFMRGIGLPDIWMEYAGSFEAAVKYYSCFISYSTKDQVLAERIHADLQDAGVRCWFATNDMKIGDKIWDSIDQAIRLRDKILLIISEDAIRSDWVEDEVSKGFAEERAREHTIIFPIRLDDAVMRTNEPWAIKLRDQRHIGDFSNWRDIEAYRKSFARLVRDLTVSN